jgi:hypothetical protein
LCNHFLLPGFPATSSPFALRVRDWARIIDEPQFKVDWLALAYDVSTFLDVDRATGLLRHPKSSENFDQVNRLGLP